MQHRPTATAPMAIAASSSAQVSNLMIYPALPSGTRSGSNSNNSNRTTSGSRLRRTAVYLVGAVLVFTQVILPYLLVPTHIDTNQNVLSPPGSLFSTTFSSSAGSYFDQADGFFNNVPIVRVPRDSSSIQQQQQQSPPFYSTVHCVGETHDVSNAWMYRSCQFHNLCFDTNRSDFVVLENPIETMFQSKRVDHSFISTSMLDDTSSSVAIGGINPRWKGKDFNQGMEKVKWFPRILSVSEQTNPGNNIEYYQLPPHVVFVPFHSLAAHNVGHLLWDDFLPIYTLLQLFGLANDQQEEKESSSLTQQQQQQLQKTPIQHLLLRAVFPGQLLYGTCEMRRKKGKKCAQNFQKFLPLLGVDPETFSTTRDYKLVWKNSKQQPPTSSSSSTKETTTLICAKQGVAGMGMLTDHGFKDHGWNPSPQQDQSQTGLGQSTPVHNVGRGPLLYNFRNYLVHNFLGRSSSTVTTTLSATTPFTIVISTHSSSDVDRDLGFDAQITVLRQTFPDTSIQVVQFSNMTLLEQVQLVSKTSLLITTCGGGAMTATFLPRGASVIFYYQESGGFDFEHFNLTGNAAILDWDLFNNAAYLRVHWLPIGTMNTQPGLESLMYLIRHEMVSRIL